MTPSRPALEGGPHHGTLVFGGTSMWPTLPEPAMLELAPGPPRVGDVVAFAAPDSGVVTVHRVVGLGPDGFRTRGDHNPADDSLAVPPEAVLGRVVAARLGQRRWAVSGGGWGLAWHRLLRLRRTLLRAVRPAIGLWRRFAAGVAQRLPARWRPRVVVYTGGRAQALFGARVVARRRAAGARWEVHGWCRLITDEELLP